MDSSTTRTTYRRRWTEAVHLFVLFAALYGLMGRGTFFTSDEGGIINTALAILGRGSFAIAPGENIHRGPDGRFYACREFLPTLLCLPTAFAGSLFESALRPPPPPVAPLGGRLDGTNWLFFLTITFLGPALAAGTLVVLYQTVLDVGGSRTAALWLSVVAGLSTPIVFYARTIFPQILETLLLATAFYSAIHWRSGGTSRSALTMGVACGLGLMTRAAFAPVVVWFLGFLLLTGSTSWRRRLGCMLLFAVPVVVGGAVTGWYNWVRWGSPFDSGYHNPNEAFTTPLMTGVVGLLFSPGKGLFVYAPGLLAPLLALPLLWRRGAAEVVLLLGITATYLGIYGRWYDWEGGLAWGPRFLTALIVPWLALLGRVWTEDRPPWSGWLALALFPLGLLVQTPAILVHPKWMAWNGAELFSLSRAHAVILWQRVLHAGPDDLWLWGRGPGVGSTTLLVAVGLSVLVFGAGGLLWRTTRSRIEAAALLPPLAATTALLLAGWLFA